jgi:hypothetical protein
MTVRTERRYGRHDCTDDMTVWAGRRCGRDDGTDGKTVRTAGQSGASLRIGAGRSRGAGRRRPHTGAAGVAGVRRPGLSHGRSRPPRCSEFSAVRARVESSLSGHGGSIHSEFSALCRQCGPGRSRCHGEGYEGMEDSSTVSSRQCGPGRGGHCNDWSERRVGRRRREAARAGRWRTPPLSKKNLPSKLWRRRR